MEDATTLAELIKEVGFPVVAALLGAAGFWLMLKWMMSIVIAKIDGLYKKLDDQNKIIIAIIERLRVVDNDLIRLDTAIRLLRGLDLDWERLGRRDPKDSRKD